MANKISNRNEWIFSKLGSFELDKEDMARDEVLKMVNKTIKMFKYDNLPPTISVRDIELYNQLNGFSIWAKVNGNLYVFFGGLGGIPNEYYLPTEAIIANPYLKFSKNLKIGSECIVMLNDYFYRGLLPTHKKYAHLIVEGEISLDREIINSRVPALVQADNERSKKSAEEFFNKIESGKGYGVIASAEFFEGIKSQDFYTESHITHIIEAIQYIRGSWYNEIGIKSSFNMKREALNEAETSLNDDTLKPTINTMLQCRQDAVKKINEMFGTNIKVSLDSVWLENLTQELYSLESIKYQSKILKNESENTKDDEKEDVKKNED